MRTPPISSGSDVVGAATLALEELARLCTPALADYCVTYLLEGDSSIARVGVALVLAAGTLWSLMGLGLRQIETASVWQILFWRSAGMVPVLLGFIWWTSGGRPLVALRGVGAGGVIGGLCLVLAFAGAIYAIQTTTIANALYPDTVTRPRAGTSAV